MSKRVLVACEESQRVCIEFRKLGFEAYSCDVLECSGGHPEWHIKDDIINTLNTYGHWDIIIMHPDCTYLAVSGNRWYANTRKRIDAIEWTQKLFYLAKIYSPRVCVENPVSVVFKYLEHGNLQYIQPWQFGHGETKKTGLYLHNLPELKPTNIVDGREQKVWKMPPSKDRKKIRSKTFPGIAKAMADQWGKLL